jgi:hypothetical protein
MLFCLHIQVSSPILLNVFKRIAFSAIKNNAKYFMPSMLSLLFGSEQEPTHYLNILMLNKKLNTRLTRKKLLIVTKISRDLKDSIALRDFIQHYHSY